MTTGSLMKIESIAEFCNAFDLHYAIIDSVLKNIFGHFESGRLHRFTVFKLYLLVWLNKWAY